MKKILLTVAIALTIGSLVPSGAQAITQPVSLEQARNMTGLSWTLDKFLGSSTAFLGAGLYTALASGTTYQAASINTAIASSTAFLGAGVYTAIGGSTAFLGAGIYSALGEATAFQTPELTSAIGGATAFLAATLNSVITRVDWNRTLNPVAVSGTVVSMAFPGGGDAIAAGGTGMFVIPFLSLPGSGSFAPPLATNVNSYQRDFSFSTNVTKGAAVPYVFNVPSVVTNQGNQAAMRWGTLTGTVSQDSNVVSFTGMYATPLMGKPVAISGTTFMNKTGSLGGYAEANYSVGSCDNISATLINLTTAGSSAFIPAGTYAWGISVSLDSATGFVVVSPVSIQYAQADIGEETGRIAVQVGPNVIAAASLPPISHDNQNFPTNYPIFLFPGPGSPATLKLHFWWMRNK